MAGDKRGCGNGGGFSAAGGFSLGLGRARSKRELGQVSFGPGGKRRESQEK